MGRKNRVILMQMTARVYDVPDSRLYAVVNSCKHTFNVRGCVDEQYARESNLVCTTLITRYTLTKAASNKSYLGGLVRENSMNICYPSMILPFWCRKQLCMTCSEHLPVYGLVSLFRTLNESHCNLKTFTHSLAIVYVI